MVLPEEDGARCGTEGCRHDDRNHDRADCDQNHAASPPVPGAPSAGLRKERGRVGRGSGGRRKIGASAAAPRWGAMWGAIRGRGEGCSSRNGPGSMGLLRAAGRREFSIGGKSAIPADAAGPAGTNGECDDQQSFQHRFAAKGASRPPWRHPSGARRLRGLLCAGLCGDAHATGGMGPRGGGGDEAPLSGASAEAEGFGVDAEHVEVRLRRPATAFDGGRGADRGTENGDGLPKPVEQVRRGAGAGGSDGGHDLYL